MDMEDLVELMAVVLALMVPIVAIVGTCWVIVVRTKQKTNLKNNMVSLGTDPDLARELVAAEDGTRRKWKTLRWACVLLGLGLGAAACYLLHLTDADDIFLWIVLASGAGLGLLVDFLVEMKAFAEKDLPDSGAEKTLEK